MKNNKKNNNYVLMFGTLIVMVLILCYLVKNENQNEEFNIIAGFQKVFDVGKTDVHYIYD